MRDKQNTINEYIDESGKSLYADWLSNLRDARAKAKIMLQVDKMELGLFGDLGFTMDRVIGCTTVRNNSRYFCFYVEVINPLSLEILNKQKHVGRIISGE